jgi:hypothetical protein
MKLALVHDVAEAIVGDITPTCGVSDADKHALESAAVQRIKAMLGGTTLAGEEIEQLWLEYEAGQTAEAQLVKDFDKVGAAWWVLPGGCCLEGAAWWVPWKHRAGRIQSGRLAEEQRMHCSRAAWR